LVSLFQVQKKVTRKKLSDTLLLTHLIPFAISGIISSTVEVDGSLSVVAIVLIGVFFTIGIILLSIGTYLM
jgi:hypothetical protein